jgi:hypothetical protein
MDTHFGYPFLFFEAKQGFEPCADDRPKGGGADNRAKPSRRACSPARRAKVAPWRLGIAEQSAQHQGCFCALAPTRSKVQIHPSASFLLTTFSSGQSGRLSLQLEHRIRRGRGAFARTGVRFKSFLLRQVKPKSNSMFDLGYKQKSPNFHRDSF